MENKKIKYKCVKDFCVDSYDADGFLIENDCVVIPKGSVWVLDKDANMIIGSKNCVHLDHVSKTKFDWIEITQEHLHEYFEEVPAWFKKKKKKVSDRE